MLISTTLAEALDMLAADPSSLVLAGGTDADGRDEHGSPARPKRSLRSTVSPSCARGRTTRDTQRAHRRSRHLRRADAGAACCSGARARPGGPHRRLAADPPCRDDRRQRGDLLAGGRRAARARGARRGRPPRLVRRLARRAVRRLRDRSEAHRPAAGRADQPASRCRCSTAARATARSACATRW